MREQNFSLALNYHRGIIATELFFSRFDTKLGIFRAPRRARSTTC
ncbi:MAG: hypothetical protein WKG07_43705 [Hymenobacter sp.]